MGIDGISVPETALARAITELVRDTGLPARRLLHRDPQFEMG